MKELIFKGTRDRLRPVMLTASAAAMGFLPMAISTGSGAEVQRPLATVVIGGLITSTMLTMIALPLFFSIFNNSKYMRNPFRKISKSGTATILLLFFFSGIGFGQDKGLSLQEAIDIAINNNKELHAYTLRIEEQKALKPTSFNIDKTKMYYEYDQNNIAENGYPLNVIGVEQSLSFPTVYAAQKNINNQNVSIAETMLKKQKQKLIKDVSQSYYKIQLLLNKQKIYSEIDSLYSDFLNKTMISYKEGSLNELEMMNAMAKQQKIRLIHNTIKHDLKIAYRQLKTYMQNDSTFDIQYSEPSLVTLNTIDINSNPGLSLMDDRMEYQNRMLKLERNKLAPDITLNYFIGSNHYDNAKSYNGFHVGLGIPLFFGEQKARIKAKQIAININRELRDNYEIKLQAEYSKLLSNLEKYKEAIDYYEKFGRDLSSKIIRNASESYKVGEIDFFRFALSIENALNLTLNYFDNIAEYNRLALELNYLQLNN